MNQPTEATDYDPILREAGMGGVLDILRCVAERYNHQRQRLDEAERYVVKLERQVADGERDAELLELLVKRWTGTDTVSAYDRIEELIKERNAADGLAHDDDRD